MSTPVPSDPQATDTTDPVAPAKPHVESPDPITGEPDAHPVGVGAGALAAGAAGAAIGAIGGPIGVLIGATIGAIAGGLAGHEVAAAPADPETPVSLDKPLPTASSGLITPDESSFLADSSSADSGVTGEAPLLTESALPAAFATSAEPESSASTDREETSFDTNPAYTSHLSTEQTIRLGAYYRYLGREEEHQPGTDFEDWIAAETEVLQR